MKPFWPETLVDWAQVLSAIGTLAAVLVSLYLAARKPRPELKGSAYLAVLFGSPQWGEAERPQKDVIRMQVTNVGSIDARITSVGWCIDMPWPGEKIWMVQLLENKLGTESAAIPATISHGSEWWAHLTVEGKESWFETIRLNGFGGRELDRRGKLDWLKLVVSVSVGPAHMLPVDQRLADKIWEAHSEWLAGQRGA